MLRTNPTPLWLLQPCRSRHDKPARCLYTQGDDEKASRKNFTDCPIKDYRPMIKSLITEPPYLDILVYSGDVDAQIPHTATEAWTSQLGVPLKAGGEWRPWSQPDDSGDPAVLGCTLLLFFCAAARRLLVAHCARSSFG